MYCRNCGQKLADGDKFCSACGTKAPAADNAAEGLGGIADVTPDVAASAPADEKPLFEPFDFKAFGFDFADLGLGTGAKKEEPAAEESKPTPPEEKFDWNTGAFPDTKTTTKTEDINFNWSLSPDEPEVPAAVEPEIFTAEEPKWKEPESTVADLEAELFGDIESKADETRKQSEEIDKFFTFHKKNEEFQKILDREYEKVKTGNIITEEINAAEAAVSEEKIPAREPEDPMEALFAEAGVIKGYEPKPIETDILERIDAIDEEKRIREEAARIAEAKKAEMAAAESATEEIPVEEVPAAEEAPAAEPVAEEVQDEEPAVIEIQAEDVPAEEEPEIEKIIEEPVQEEMPEKTKQVDKAAILAEMALASEMVERDRAMAAAQEAAAAQAAEEAAAAAEEVKMEVPDFLGHDDTPAVEETPAAEPVIEVAEILESEETPAEEEPVIEVAQILGAEDVPAAEPAVEEAPVAEAEPAAEEGPEPDLELDIFEQLEAQESPAAEIILPEHQTIEDLFAETVTEPAEETVTEHTVILTEDSVAEILKTVEEDTTKDDTMVFTAHALGALLAEAEQEDPDAKEVVVSLEDLTTLEQQAAEGTLNTGIVAEAAEEDEEEYKGGKGRTFLKVCLVILVILLAIEIAGVAIKIAAPTSGAANFIDTQLHKVFQLFGDEDTTPDNYNA